MRGWGERERGEGMTGGRGEEREGGGEKEVGGEKERGCVAFRKQAP